jgi:hypothetical protein
MLDGRVVVVTFHRCHWNNFRRKAVWYLRGTVTTT